MAKAKRKPVSVVYETPMTPELQRKLEEVEDRMRGRVAELAEYIHIPLGGGAVMVVPKDRKYRVPGIDVRFGFM